jgi:N,N'-diacetyllegionaminate synthase
VAVMKKNKLYIIAEVGSVHDGSFGNACKLIEQAAKCGANAVKFQTHFGNLESIKTAPRPYFFKSEDRIKYFDRTKFDSSEYKKFINVSKKNKIDFLSSPFALEAVDFLEKINIKSYKIPSGEITNLPLLEKIKKTKKKVFLSTGMSNWKEIDQAVNILKKNCDLTIMQCTSLYPCPDNKIGINVIKEMIKRYKLPVGFSDHTLGYEASIAAVMEGATVIEKHITFSKHMYGSDAFNAMEIQEFKNFCISLKRVFFIKNSKVDKNNINYLNKIKKTFEKSIVLNDNLKKKKLLTLNDLAFKKPGNGISAQFYKKIIGKKLKRDLKKDYLLKYKDFY